MRSSLRFAVVYLATVVVAFMVAPTPAQAGTLQDIWNLVAQADAANGTILNQFTVAAIGSDTIDELNQARAQADASLDGVWNTTIAALDAIAAENPAFADDVEVAKSVVTNDHNEAHAEVGSIYDAVYDSLTGSTTTTTSPTTTTSSTTTTTKPPVTTTTTIVIDTTTTTKPNTNTTTTTLFRPTTTTTTTTAPPTTTTTAPSTTTTTVPGAVIPPGTPPSDGEPTGIDDPNVILTAPAVLDSVEDEATASASQTDTRSRTGPVSGVISDGVSQVFPPAIAQFTAAPFVVFELLVMTLFDSIRTMFLPFVAITLVMLAFLWSERRRETETFPA